MTRDERQSFAAQHIAAWQRRDPAALAADHAVDGIVESPMFATLHGRQAIEEAYRALFTPFPDWTLTVDDLLIDPPKIAAVATARATHENDFFGLAGTHRKIDVHNVRVLTLADGLIARETRIYDFTGLLVQVGVLRAKPARP